MVQKQVQKPLQAKGSGSPVTDDTAMPQFMFKSPSGTGYLFRRAVPADVREVIGKREFKVTLGGDYRSASQRCRELAVQTDQQIAAARTPAPPESSGSSAQLIAQSPPPLVAIRAITPDLVARLHATVINQVLNADRERRYRTRQPTNPAETLKEIERIRSWASLARHGDDTAVYGWAEMLAGTLQRNGYRLAPELHSSVQERELLIEYASAYRNALDILAAECNGKPATAWPQHAEPLKPAEPTPTAAPVPPAMLLSTAIDEFLKHLSPGKRAMNVKHNFILPAFKEVVGDMPITELRQAHIKDFLHTVQKLPPRWSDLRRKNGKTIRELASKTWPETLSLNTYEGAYLASLRTFLERAKTDWQDIGFPTTLTVNIPYLGTRTKIERKQRALKQHEIQAIFLNEKMMKIIKSNTNVYKFWLLAIELYTGARVREICQINPQHDWGCTDGQWWLRLTDEAGEQPDPLVIKSIKTGKPRTIPLHAELIRLGLPDYLERLKQAGARRLFPQWIPTTGDAGVAPGKWVVNYMHSIHLHGSANELGNAIRGSHSFRHTFLTHGRLKGVNLRCISGHSEASSNRVADGYEDQTMLIPLPVMSDRLAKLDYGVVLPVPIQTAATLRLKRAKTSSPRVKTRR